MSHWDDTYTARPEDTLTWYEDAPRVSLDLIEQAGLPPGSSAIDIGAGASRLAACLLDRGFGHVTRLDLSADGLRLGASYLPGQADVSDIVADVTRWTPDRVFDLWHDRAAFHFLTDPAEQARYLGTLHAATRPGSVVVLAGFASDGPERCSNLPVVRRDEHDLFASLGEGFEKLASLRHVHHTPKGNTQPFSYILARRKS